MKLFPLIWILLFSCYVNCWENEHGWNRNMHSNEICHNLGASSDGVYIVGVFKNGRKGHFFQRSRGLMVGSFDFDGNVKWLKNIKSDATNYTGILSESLLVSRNGEIMAVSGYMEGSHSTTHEDQGMPFISRIDMDGNVLMSKAFNDTYSVHTHFTSLVVDDNGNFWGTGYFLFSYGGFPRRNLVFAKLDSEMKFLHGKYIGSRFECFIQGMNIHKVSDGFIVTGYGNVIGGYTDYIGLIIKFDNNGTMTSFYRFLTPLIFGDGITNSKIIEIENITKLVIVGSPFEQSKCALFSILNLNESSIITVNNTLRVCQNSDHMISLNDFIYHSNEFVCVGRLVLPGGVQLGFIMRVSTEGNLLSISTLKDFHEIASIVEMNDGGIVIAGQLSDEFALTIESCTLVRLNNDGRTCHMVELDLSGISSTHPEVPNWEDIHENIMSRNIANNKTSLTALTYDPLSQPDQSVNSTCWSCYGVDMSNIKVCSSHGVCEDWDSCHCDLSHFGAACESWNCFGVSSENISEVCGNNVTNGFFGYCSDADICTCTSGYYSSITLGKECLEWSCLKYDRLDSENVCSGHGNCVAPNKCDCIADYKGSFCETYDCGKIEYDDDEVCSGRGTCISPDVCRCKSLYSGDVCQESHVWIVVVTPFLSVIGGLVTLFLCFCCVCCMCGCCVLVFVLIVELCSVAGIGGLSIFQKKRLSVYHQLEGIDLLIHEQEMEKDESIAHLKINKRQFEIPYEEIKIEKMIGNGGSDATVFLGTWKGEQIAFKSFNTRRICSSQESFDLFEVEVGLLISLKHPNIIRFFGASLKPPRVGFVTEFCSNGEILDFFQKYREDHSRIYPTKEKLRMCKEIISSVEYIHSRNVIHRDIKSENVLIDSSEKTKLTDFGIARIVESQGLSNLTKKIGTSMYMSPEVLSGVYDEKCDSFSFAILLVVMFSENGQPYGENPGNISVKVSNDPTFRPDLNLLNLSFGEDGGYEWVKELIRKCWDHDASRRYSFSDLFQIFENQETKTLNYDEEDENESDDGTSGNHENVRISVDSSEAGKEMKIEEAVMSIKSMKRRIQELRRRKSTDKEIFDRLDVKDKEFVEKILQK